MLQKINLMVEILNFTNLNCIKAKGIDKYLLRSKFVPQKNYTQAYKQTVKIKKKLFLEYLILPN
jgi:hypothetical protein